jgi:hypothetical protein
MGGTASALTITFETAGPGNPTLSTTSTFSAFDFNSGHYHTVASPAAAPSADVSRTARSI